MQPDDRLGHAAVASSQRSVVDLGCESSIRVLLRYCQNAIMSAKARLRSKRTTADDLHSKWMKNPKYRREYQALEEEFSLAAALIEARARAGLTQEQVAQRMKTTQAVVARLEGGGSMPSTRTLEKYAKATGTRLKISFEPELNARLHRNRDTGGA